MIFEPKFTVVSIVKEAADLINLPHEDYPHRVQITEDLINYLIFSHSLYNTEGFTLFHCREIHGQVMWDCWHKGSFRTIDVTVGGNPTPPPSLVPALIEPWFPVYRNSELKLWYKNFQLIHPFVDGNGRVGGIVVAYLSYIKSNGKEILVPCQ